MCIHKISVNLVNVEVLICESKADVLLNMKVVEFYKLRHVC